MPESDICFKLSFMKCINESPEGPFSLLNTKFAVLCSEKNERTVELECEPELIFNPRKPKHRLYIV